MTRDFLELIKEAEDGDARRLELRRISQLMRVVRRFYETFLTERYELTVVGFSYRSKRAVARRLVREEADAQAAERPEPRAALELAALFEDLCDLFHGDLEFGYSNDDDDYAAFHQDAFPEWLKRAASWTRTKGEQALATDLEHLEASYSSVAATAF